VGSFSFAFSDRYVRCFREEDQGRLLGDRAFVLRSVQRGVAVPDQFDVSLEDSDLLVEVELTTNLIIAASESDTPLDQEQIDQLLGIPRVPEQGRR
jgi:hypothetical protein